MHWNDKKRIDWMFTRMYYPAHQDNKGKYWVGTVGPFNTVRQAIDAAMKKENKGK